MTDFRMERFKYTLAVVLYGTIGMFVRYVMPPAGWIGSVLVIAAAMTSELIR